MTTERWPIRARLTVWYTAVLSVGLILFSVSVWLMLRHELQADLAGTLTNQVRGFEEYLQIEDRDRAPDMVNEMDEYSRSLPQDHLLAVYDDAGTLLYGSHGDSGFTLAERFQTEPAMKPIKVVWQGRPYLAMVHRIALQRTTMHAYLAISSAATDRAISLLGYLLALAVPVFVACAAAGGYWLSGKALSPVDRITERARSIGVKNLSERLAVPHTGDELERLTETWNGMLERLDGAVGRISRFTADASHELRTPVAIVRLAAECALRKPRSEAAYRAALERIRRESEGMTKLIEDLLFLARADAEASTIGCERIELRTLASDICADMRPLLTEKELTLREILPAQPVPVVGFESDLRRMLLILLDNAIKYTPKGGEIAVRIEQGDQQAILRVEDSGIGIPEEARAHVFERFFRADPSRNRESGGYGLGLAIAQAIVERHNAAIDLQPRQGGGCVFSISLPMAA